jgi:uncharacterized phiE125 gp8 family phage protein
MSLAPNALTTLAEQKEYLKLNNTETTDDGLVEFLINAASSAIENKCKRKFKEQTYTDEEYDGNGFVRLYLQQYPVKSVTSVFIDDTEISADQYKIKKNNGALIRKGSFWPTGDINILVTYTAGYTEIPFDLELACKHLVMSYFKSDVASFSTTFQEGIVFRPEALPSQVKVLIGPYEKVM